MTALADTLVVRARDILTDTTYALPHDPAYDGLGTVLWITAAIVVVVIGGLLYGLYRWTQ